MRIVFSDGTKEFRDPMEPGPGDRIKLRLRVEKGCDARCTLVTDKERYPMHIVSERDPFVFYEAELICPEENFGYWFELESDKLYYYNLEGITQEHDPAFDLVIMPGFKTPDWAKGAVMYQIFVDRFCNGDPTNDVLNYEYNYLNGHVKHIDDWYKDPDASDVRNFYGGDLAGVMKNLPYLKRLGIEAIYFNPLFVSPSNHKYDIQDYDYIDPHLTPLMADEGEVLRSWDYDNSHATRFRKRVTDTVNLEAANAYFARFVEEAHQNGIKVILDGVFNHCGSFNKWLDRQLIYDKAEGYEKGAYRSEKSPYRTFFRFAREDWPDNTSYEGWWGHETLPKLNYEDSKELFDYVMKIAAKWVSPPYNCDGWRLDVAADLGFSPEYNHFFWKEFRKTVKAANPEAVIIAENYSGSDKWLKGGEWDSIMNYEAFMEPLTWFLTGMEKHSDSFSGDMLNNTEAFKNAMRTNMAKMNIQSLLTSMNQLSNHDHSRFLTRTNRRVGRLHYAGASAAGEGVNPACMREAVVVQMTWPGAPTLYYGDEAGLCGWTDPDNRRTYPWGREDKGMLEFYREMISLHKAYQVLRTGAFRMLPCDSGVLCYGRFNSEEQVLVVINNNDEARNTDIDVMEIGAGGTPLVRLVRTGYDGYDFCAEMFRPEEGKISLRLEPCTAIVLKNLPKHLL